MINEFETRPVSELHGTSTKYGALHEAFATMIEGTALLYPCTVSRKKMNTVGGALRRKYPNRKVHAKANVTRDGVWFWWEPKP